MIKRALISVYRKEGVVELAHALMELGVEIISTGGTAKLLAQHGVRVKTVSEVTGFPEILDGRVKTLHPRIHGGILAMRSAPDHVQQVEKHGIPPIDLVCVNLYPFQETVSRPDVTQEEAIENIDIGGPAMIRAAAKNYKDVVVLVNPASYEVVLKELREQGDVSPETRFALAHAAYGHTAAYDAAIHSWFSEQLARTHRAAVAGGPEAHPESEGKPDKDSPFPALFNIQLTKVQDLRYGENPHQRAALYRGAGAGGATLIDARQLHGKELSYNNIADAQAAIDVVLEFQEPCAVAVKHANPCGVGTADTIAAAFRKAYAADEVSIFGGIVALNRTCDAETAQVMAKIFLEVVVAPGYTDGALAILEKKKDLRILLLPGLKEARNRPDGFDFKRIMGGFLVQDFDTPHEDAARWECVTQEKADAATLADLWFAWRVCKHVKSNAIVVAKGGQTLGIGMGQPNRIDSARHAIRRAGDGVKGAVLASDAFFPFPDVVEAAGGAQIAAIAQPGGSIRDKESIERANSLGIAMYFTAVRHFKH